MPDQMNEISERLRSQDNRATQDPLFIVQQKALMWGVDSDYDGYEWRNLDGERADEQESGKLDMGLGVSLGQTWIKCYYKVHWEFVTACFTEQGCKDYITLNGHNLNSPRIYVASAYRNTEWIAIRKYLMSLNEKTPGS